MTKDKGEGLVFRPGGAGRLLNDAGEDLTDDERALLLALISVDAEAGKGVAEKEQPALDKLKSQMEGYDVEALAQAAKHVVTAKPRQDRTVDWPELKRGRSRRSAEE